MADEDEVKVRSLLIPVKNSTQAVEVFVDELPDDVNDIIDILRAEIAPLDVWLKFAVRLVLCFRGRVGWWGILRVEAVGGFGSGRERAGRG
jgi:hypothetical protein